MGGLIHAVDLDGTLLQSDAEISKRSMCTIQRVVDAKDDVIVNTGRRLVYAEKLIEGLPVQYLICSNGSLIYDRFHGKVIYSDTIRPEVLREVQGATNHLDIDYRSFDSTQISFASADKDVLIQAQKAIFSAGLFPAEAGIELTYNSDRSFSFGSVTANKGAGLQVLCDYLNTPIERAIVYGDEMNDISMFAVAGTRVAMGNAIPQLKAMADYITDTNQNDGVAKFMEMLL